MSDLEAGLVAYLKSYAGLTALIGTRIDPLAMPQGQTLPCLTYQIVNHTREHTHDALGAVGELAFPRIQFDIWAASYKETRQIAYQLRAALNGKTGELALGVYIRVALVENETPDYNNLDVPYLYRLTAEYLVILEEA